MRVFQSFYNELFDQTIILYLGNRNTKIGPTALGLNFFFTQCKKHAWETHDYIHLHIYPSTYLLQMC